MPKAHLIFLAGGLYAQEAIDVEARVKEITEEDSPALFSMSILNSDVALLMSGYWKGTLTGSWGLAKTAAGWGVASVDSPVLFMQEADLLSISLAAKFRASALKICPQGESFLRSVCAIAFVPRS